MSWRPAALLLALLLALPIDGAYAQEEDLDQLQAAAEAGDTDAQISLAMRYHNGVGIGQNFAHAAEWFGRAAAAGNAAAQNQLGRYYHSGLGVSADRAEALRWLEAAAEQGAPEHLFDLAAVLEEISDDPQALKRAAQLYQRAAEAGNVDAAVSLGVLYQNGSGVTQDFARAKGLYEPAAEKGHARALNNLGLLYVRGTGVPQDYDRAAQLFAHAAKQGLTQAVTNLGVMYQNGFGVPQDDTEAARLYRLAGAGVKVDGSQGGFVYDIRLAPPPAEIATLRTAALAGDPVAEFQMGWLLVTQDVPQPMDWQEAAQLFSAAAQKGHLASMANLGLLYMQGRGVPQDFVLAQMWLSLAGSGGLESTAAPLAELQQRMTPAQINEAQARTQARADAALHYRP